MPGTYRKIRGRATYRYNTSTVYLPKTGKRQPSGYRPQREFKFAQMGKLNGKAILKIQTANYFAESLNIINIENRKEEKD